MTVRRSAARRVPLPLAAAAAILVAAASCDSPTMPEDMTGVYVLESTATGPVSREWRDYGDWSVRELADTLFLRAGRVGEQVFEYEFTVDSTPADTVRVRDVWPFEYELKGYHVIFRFREVGEPVADGSGGYRMDQYTGNAIISSGRFVYAYRGR